MLDAIVRFFTRTFQAIGRGLGLAVAFVLKPFVWLGRWFTSRGVILKILLGVFLLGIVVLYGYFFWTTQRWNGFDPDYARVYETRTGTEAGTPKTPTAGIITSDEDAKETETAVKTCRRSLLVDATADLVDFNVNQNAWISSMLLYKIGLFGLDWDKTPFFDNKASFQRGVNQAVRRTTIELVDTLGRVRGTSQIDPDLQSARGSLQFDESTWYFGWSPFGPKTPTPSFYRSAAKDLKKFNTRLEKCEAVFDARADNLLQFVDRIANDIGATSAILRERSENYNSGWFDTRADDRFWFAYGQLYGYYGILKAARTDFADVIEERRLTALWDELEQQLRASLNIRPTIISNGAESGWLMPSHLATLGFYVLRVRSNLVEIRLVLDR
ncbi:hypothetical protein AUC69_06950 [Methyloceanibacter superfactus]|uniref:DUF2333 domain-containing protein n=1 Tax=Methyloceanibacter superfactus TaxID=1774969 RepID=A0A1E3W6H0_9HYPH|nr:DUF2333 family protein [Methyloceanibacter superfactus]ODS01403.1 hypothetical protein AUC69_06950 [Methyloceanibacter superfactus]